MKKGVSVKTRITIWYAALMLFMITVVLLLVGTLSYRLSIDNIKKDVTLQVTKVSESIAKRQLDVFHMVDSEKEFKNVSIYETSGKYIAGQYNYDVAGIEFKEGYLRKEKVDNKEYIVYDVSLRHQRGEHSGIWIRGAESVSTAMLLGRSAAASLLIIIPIILLITVLGGYYITKKAFSPINNIIKTADDIALQSDITRRIEISPNAKADELLSLSLTLNKMLDKIEASLRNEKRFTQDASHELRTPISVILAQGEYLCEIAQSDKEKELAEDIVLKAKRMSTLVSRLLLLSRIDQNRQKFNSERIDLAVVCDIAADGMRELAKARKVKLITELEENIIVSADEALLVSAVSNLISNGIKYGKEGSYVLVRTASLEGFSEITVEDNGIGIAKENLDKIWERFYRVDSVRNDDYGSCGLGLSVVKSIVRLCGGEISVKSELGKGTAFKIRFKN